MYSMSCRLKVTITGNILKPQISQHGYHAVRLKWFVEGISKQKKIFVHRLVGEAFIPNAESKPFINHKNTIKTDNFFKNLEWVTNAENMKHAQEMGIFPKAKPKVLKGYSPGNKPVKNIETGEVFPYVAAIVVKEGYNKFYFWRQLRGERPNPTPYRYA